MEYSKFHARLIIDTLKKRLENTLCTKLRYFSNSYKVSTKEMQLTQQTFIINNVTFHEIKGKEGRRLLLYLIIHCLYVVYSHYIFQIIFEFQHYFFIIFLVLTHENFDFIYNIKHRHATLSFTNSYHNNPFNTRPPFKIQNCTLPETTLRPSQSISA